ncbi:urease accessory protein UreJ [filamentous cyanobacterium CCP5]|nr:urease accessory protein UreJ [filamentous cyanobacterium CCP5]
MIRLQSISALGLSSKQMATVGLAAALGLLFATPALAHHPFGGATPTNAIEGFLSGLGHPVIGLDHLAFVVTAGLLAAVMGRGLLIPAAFVVASLGGTGLHLAGANLPAPEFCISASVLIFGGLLAMKQRPQDWLVVALAAVAGMFHGYAYGEAVIGAEMAPLFAYLLGFASIQLAIAAAACTGAKRLAAGEINLRFAGFTLAGAGAAFLSSVVLG